MEAGEPNAMKILIVHAHHEAKSFSSALYVQAKNTLLELGHQVVVSDLYAQAFDPVSDRRNFTTCADANFLKQQAEEAFASPVDEQYHQLIPAEMARVAELQRQGVLLQSSIGAPGSEPWRAFLQFRESSPQEVLEHLHSLPLAAYLDFEITELMKIPAPSPVQI